MDSSIRPLKDLFRPSLAKWQVVDPGLRTTLTMASTPTIHNPSMLTLPGRVLTLKRCREKRESRPCRRMDSMDNPTIPIGVMTIGHLAVVVVGIMMRQRPGLLPGKASNSRTGDNQPNMIHRRRIVRRMVDRILRPMFMAGHDVGDATDLPGSSRCLLFFALCAVAVRHRRRCRRLDHTDDECFPFLGLIKVLLVPLMCHSMTGSGSEAAGTGQPDSLDCVTKSAVTAASRHFSHALGAWDSWFEVLTYQQDLWYRKNCLAFRSGWTSSW